MESGTGLQKGVEPLPRGLLREHLLPCPSPVKVTLCSQLQNFAFFVAPPLHIHKLRTLPQEIIFPERIIEVNVPNSLPFHDNMIGDKGTDVAIGDVTKDSTMLLCSILKRRRKKMKKHKFRKRRKRDLFKRRNIENTRARKKKAKERKEERRRQREA